MPNNDQSEQTSWTPNRKVISGAVAGLVVVAVKFLTTGELNPSELHTPVAVLTAAYLIPENSG